MTVSVNPRNIGRTVSGRGKALFVLIIAVIAAIAIMVTAGCGGKASAKVGQTEKPTDFWSGWVNTDWYDEDENEFVINTAEELAGLAELVNEEGEIFKGKTIRLGRDIVINDTANWRNWANEPPAHQWTRIGTDTNHYHFYGTFDGGGHTVSGIYIKDPEGDQGLFGVIGRHGKVRRLNITASYIEGEKYVGLLAGGSFGVISECHISGAVIGDSIVGGLIGVNDGLIKNCYAVGSVKGRFNVGGLIGANRSGAAAGNYSVASVSGDSVVGGFVGGNWEGMISGNFSAGKVTGSVSVGGFAGRGRGSAMRNNYYDRETSGQSDSGKGEGKTTAQMQSAELVDSLNAAAGILSISAWIHADGKYPAQRGEIADTVNISGFFASGKGTEDDPYIISTREHLAGLSILIDMGESFSGKYLKLGRDIAFNDTTGWRKWAIEPPAYAYTWEPAGHTEDSFDGTLDGGGHTISGIYANKPKYHMVGLLRFMSENATIKNIGITASYFRGDSVVGSLVAHNAGRIINCYSTAVVTAEGFVAGGLVAHNDGRIINCYSTAVVAAEGIVAGGLVGGNRGAIIGCYATGTVSGGAMVGGLAGGNSEGGAIIGCYATGAVSGSGMVGGLVGISAEGRISNCYSTGAVSGDTAKMEDCKDYEGCVGVGGLVGLNGSDIINCYTAGTVKGDGGYIGPLVGVSRPGAASKSYFDSEASGVEDNDIGKGRTTEQMKQKETFAGWDFNTVWIMDPAVNGGYPHLSGKFDESAADDLDDGDDEDDDDD